MTTSTATVSSITTQRSVLRELGWIAAICAITALGAHAKVWTPFTPVPMTLQLVGVLLAGLVLRPVAAAAAMVAYVGLGTLGLPMFVPGSAGLMGVTAGYLVGFVIAAFVTAMIARSARGTLGRGVAVGVGAMIVLTMGSLWLAVSVEPSLADAFTKGFKPFVVKAAVEAAIAVAAFEAFGFATSLIGKASDLENNEESA